MVPVMGTGDSNALSYLTGRCHQKFSCFVLSGQMIHG